MAFSPQHSLAKHLKNTLQDEATAFPREGYLNAQIEVDCLQAGSLLLQQTHQEQAIKRHLAAELGVAPNQLCLGSSPQSLRYLLLQLINPNKHDHCITLAPQRPQVQQLLQLCQVQQTVLPLQDLCTLPMALIQAQQNLNTKLLILEHPNAITGMPLQQFSIVDAVTSFEGWVLIDESAIGACPQKSMKSMVDTCENALILQRTIGGLAVLIASPTMVTVLEHYRPNLPLNQLYEANTIASTKYQEEDKRIRSLLAKERTTLQEALKGLSYVEKVYPSSTNTLLITVKNADAIVDFLRQSEQILVYRVPPIEQLQQGIRLTLGTPLDNLRLRKALEQLPEKMNAKHSFWGDVSKGLRRAGVFIGFFKKILGM